MHISTHTRMDISYSVMRLSGYMSCPKLPAFEILHQTMCYIYHHSHAPIMYPRTNSTTDTFQCHFAKGNAEFIDHKTHLLVNYNDADLARDLQDRRSVTSTLHTLHGVAVSWTCKKQTETALHSNGAEIRALATGVKQTIGIRQFFTNLGISISDPTPTHEDNMATIQQVIKDRLTPQVRHLDVLITWLSDQHNKGIFKPSYINTNMMLADINTKPLPGTTLRKTHLHIIGARFYPNDKSKHYHLLDLHKYDVFNTRVSQRKNV